MGFPGEFSAPSLGLEIENIIWGNELAFWGGDLPSLMSKMEYICDLGLPLIFLRGTRRLSWYRFGGWGLGVEVGMGEGRLVYGWSTCPPPLRTSLQKSGWKIAGLIKGNQGLISPDHKASFLAGVRFGGVGWLAIILFSEDLRCLRCLGGNYFSKKSSGKLWKVEKHARFILIKLHCVI